jgi:hypothetical protein
MKAGERRQALRIIRNLSDQILDLRDLIDQLQEAMKNPEEPFPWRDFKQQMEAPAWRTPIIMDLIDNTIKEYCS